MIKKLSKSLLDAKDEEIRKLREEVALLAAQLVANGITPERAPRHKELPVALRNFVPLTDAAGIKEVAPKLKGADEVINEAAETGLSVSASSSSLAEAAAQASSEGLEHIAPAVTEGIAAYKAAIEERVAQSDCVSSCTEALNAGNTRFEKVYESVWTYVSECEEAWHDFPTAMATLTAATKAPAGTLKQEGVSNVVDLYRQAVLAKKPFEESCAEMTKLIEALQVDAQLKLAPSLKHIGRTIEKVSFDDDPRRPRGRPRAHLRAPGRPQEPRRRPCRPERPRRLRPRPELRRAPRKTRHAREQGQRRGPGLDLQHGRRRGEQAPREEARPLIQPPLPEERAQEGRHALVSGVSPPPGAGAERSKD